MKRVLAVAMVIVALGVALIYGVSYSSSPGFVGNKINIKASNFTQEAHEEWSNGSGVLLIPGGSMGNGVDIGDINNDGKYEVVTVSTDISASGLSIKYQSSLRIWGYDGSSFDLKAEKIWTTDGTGNAGDKVVKIFKYENNAYIVTAGKDVYNSGPGLGAIRIWRYYNGEISLVSNVSWRDEPGKNTTITDVYVGDVDGDGNTELVAVGYINATNYDKGEITVWHLNKDLSLSLLAKYIWSDPNNDTYAQTVDAYDFDNDGLYEIVVGGSYGFNDSGVIRSKAQISIFHYTNGKISLVRDVEWIDNDNCGVMDVKIANVAGDSVPEIVAAGGNKNLYIAGELSIWDYDLNQIARTQYYIDPEGAPGSGSHWDCLGLSLVVGDFDGDGIKDFVITGFSKGPHSGGDTFWNYLISFNYDGSSLNQIAKIYWREYDGEMSNSMVAGDIDGDGVTELILFGYGWQTGSNGEMTYYAMLYSYVYQESTVPELTGWPFILIAVLSLVFVMRRK